MEIRELISKLQSQVPGALLADRPNPGPLDSGLGLRIVWVDLPHLLPLAKVLAEEPGPAYQTLDHLSVAEIGGVLVLTYFLRSLSTGRTLALRGTLRPSGPEETVETVSVSSVWPMAVPFECENSELFGVRFVGAEATGRNFLPEGWQGYPLRKGYVYPLEYEGVPHMRAVGKTAPDEHGVLS